MEKDHDIEMLKILDQFLAKSKRYVEESVELLNGIHHSRMDNVEKHYFCFVRVVNSMTEKLSVWLNMAEEKGIKFRPLPGAPTNVVQMSQVSPRKKRMLDLGD